MKLKNASNTTVEGSENINVNSTVDPNTKAKTTKVALKRQCNFRFWQ